MGTLATREGRSAARPVGHVLLLTVLLLLPVGGLVLLLAKPELDVMYQDEPPHFWLVLSAALINVGLGLLTSETARKRSDARLFLVSMALLSSAAFLGLHALATPGVLLAGSNKGFVVATPVGLLIASVFAAASALDLDRGRRAMVMRWQGWIKAGLAVLVVLWAAVSLGGLPPLGETVASQHLPRGVQLLGIPAIGLYAFAAVRYAQLYLHRRRTLLLAVAVAYTLLAEAMFAVVLSRTWHATWWEWHLLMVVAFATIAIGARIEYRRAHSLTGTFGGLYLDSTLELIDRRRADTLAELVAALREQRPLSPILQRAGREWATADEVAVLEDAAHQLRRIDELFRPYVSPALAEGLEARTELASLGGEERDVSVLFADLAGFTAYSEAHRADEIVAMLNAYWGGTVPIVAEREGGVIERFAGDAIMVVFNAIAEQPDHALRAVRAAVGMRDQVTAVARRNPSWPEFRIAVNSGPAVVGNVGGEHMRSFTAVGDTTNVSARLQTVARPGQIVISRSTRDAIGPRAEVEAIGALDLKGKSGPVEAFELVRLTA
jgi:class 3 adenylate cyclase